MEESRLFGPVNTWQSAHKAGNLHMHCISWQQQRLVSAAKLIYGMHAMSDEPGPLSSFIADQQEWIKQLVTACVASARYGGVTSHATGMSEPSTIEMSTTHVRGAGELSYLQYD